MDHWTRYWNSSGSLNSFAEDNSSIGYTGEIKGFWEKHIAELRPNAVVVDLGTGNGAIPFLISEYAQLHNLSLELHGVDAAEIQPAKTFNDAKVAAILKKVKFHSSTPVEELGLADASVDLFTSQFAIEYTERHAALKNCVRMLRDNGELIAITHYIQSSLVADSKVGIEVLNRCLKNTPIQALCELYIDLAAQAYPQIGLEGWQRLLHQQTLTQSIQWMFRQILEQFDTEQERFWAQDFVSRIASILGSINPKTITQSKAHLTHVITELNFHVQRLEDQVKAALDEPDVQALVDSALKLGVTVADYDSFKINEDRFGWIIKIKK